MANEKAQTPVYENKTGTQLEILQKIEKAWGRAGVAAKRNTAKSMDWFRQYVVKAYNKVGTGVVFRDRDLWKKKVKFGRMYFFEYDAKHKDKLEVWDRYPLIIPFSATTAKDGATIVYGLNMHYLPPALRLVAFRALLGFKHEARYRKTTELQFDWQAIKGLTQYKYFEHAVHAYRMDHVRSVFVEIPAQSWELMLFLPVARWVGNAAKAWSI